MNPSSGLERRLRVTAIGYLVVAVFALAALVARQAFGADRQLALLAGAVAAAPPLVAWLGDRITAVKAFSVEISLAQVTVQTQVDLSEAVMAIAEMGASAAPDLSGTLGKAWQDRAPLLRLNLRGDDYWWSTRVYLAAALAADYTSIRQLVFVRADEQRLWVGMIAPATARERLALHFPGYETSYRQLRAAVRATAAGATPLDPGPEIEQIVTGWPGTFGYQEAESMRLVTTSLLQDWLGPELDREAYQYGPLTPLLRYRINVRPQRYTALVADGALAAVVDRDALATRTADEILRRQLGG